MIRLILPLCLVCCFALRTTKSQAADEASLILAGSGCPPDSSRAELIPGKVRSEPAALALSLDGMQARQGDGLGPGERRKNCGITLALAGPRQYRLRPVVLSGDATLASGQTGRFRATLESLASLHGGGDRAEVDFPIAGPHAKGFQVELPASPWSECERAVPLSIRLEVRIEGERESAASVQLSSPIRFRLEWRDCRP